MKTHTVLLLFAIGFVVIEAAAAAESEPVYDIVGGFRAPQHAWPFTAAIYIPIFGKRMCGATIIDPQWIVTAAHCFYEYFNKTDYVIEIGGYRANDAVERHQIEEIFIHEKFDNSNYTFNDIALVKLNSTLVNSEHFFRPIPLVDYGKYDDPDEFTRCVILGWGAEGLKNDSKPGEPDFDLSDSLLQADIRLVDIDECSKKFKPFEIDPNTHLCAGGEGVGTCFGDSGSPLICFHDQRKHWFLFGITSFGIPCAKNGIPDVYTNVAAFNDWIQDTIEKNNQTDGYY